MQSRVETTCVTTPTLAHDLSLFDKVNNLTTLRKLTKDLDIKYLANGSYSQVLSLRTQKSNHDLVLKIAPLHKSEVKCDEWTFAQYLNKLIKVNQGPHFLYSHKLLTFVDRSYCFIQDKAEFDLTHILNLKLSKDVQIGLFVQLMIALHTIQSRYQIAHRDVKSDNIYLRTLDTPIKVTYETDFGTFALTLKGYWLYLGDFNVSYSFHPSYSKSGVLGERNAKLVGTTLIPISTRTSHDTNKKMFWSTGKVTNRILLRSHMTIVDKIGVYNPHIYPPFEFVDDVIDACRTFIGGRRCLLDLYHDGFVYLDSNLHDTLSGLIFSDTSYRSGTFDVNKGYLCNAGLLLQRFWSELASSESKRVAEEPGGEQKVLLYKLKGLTKCLY